MSPAALALPVLAADTGGQSVLALSLGLFALLLAAMPLALLATATIPPWPGRVAETSIRMPWRSFLLGTAVGVVLLFFGAASDAAPPFRVVAFLFLFAAAPFTLLGLTAEARRIGSRLRGRKEDPAETAGGTTAIGWLVVAGVPLFPVAGPVVFLYLALRATGAAIATLASK